MTTCGCNFQMGDGSVRGALMRPVPVTAQALGLALRHVGARAETHAYGRPGPALLSVLPALQRAGLALGEPRPVPGIGQPPLLMVLVQPAVAGQRGAAALFLTVDDPGPVPLILIPAVQKVREAAHRATRGGALGLVLVQAADSGQRAAPHEQMALNFARVDMN